MKSSSKHILLSISLIFISAICGVEVQAQFYNGTRTDFGKNRVQYDEFEWQFYRFNKFETYFYTGGKDLAQYTAKYANVRIKEIEKFLDFYLDEPIQFVIFNKQSHFRQSNIGLSTDESYNIGGVSKIVGNKLFVYYEGDYAKYTKQLDAGILRVLIYQMIYGGNWREILRNSALLHLPEWYISGLVSYLSDPNNPLVNSRIKDGILEDRFKRFNGLGSEEARVAGHSMWQYIAEIYGTNIISNVLYMTRMSREIDDGFLYVIGVSFDELYNDWIAHYKEKYETENKAIQSDFGEAVEFKLKKNWRYQNFKTGPNDRYIAYTINKLGKYKVFLYDKQTKSLKKLMTNEHKLDRIQDYTYPIIAWHPTGNLFSFVIEEKGLILMYSYVIEDEELSVKPIFKLEKVLDYTYLNSGRQMIFSAFNEGKTDLYLYNVIGNAQKKLTNDAYDDLLPQINSTDDKIFFVSNRNNDSLNVPHFEDRFRHETDIFVYDLLNDEAPISAVTNTDNRNETMPIIVDDKLYYLTQEQNRSSRYKAVYDSAVSRIDTIVHYNYFYNAELMDQYNQNLLWQSSNRNKLIDQLFYEKGNYTLYTKQLLEQDGVGFLNEKGDEYIEELDIKQKESFLVFDEAVPVRKVDIYNYEFSSTRPGLAQNKVKNLKKGLKSKDRIESLDFPTQRLYRHNFKVDESVLQLNNTFINSQYQIFNGGPYINTGIGINTKIGIVDLMEDYRVYGGFRYSGDLIEYSLTYQNLKKRLDKEFTLMRTRNRDDNASIPNDVKTLRGIAAFSWPFSEVSSLRFMISTRNDKIIPLSEDRPNLTLDIANEYWSSLKMAYVFDNTRNVALNIRYGTRFKIFAEHFRKIHSDIGDNDANIQLLESQLGFNFSGSNLSVLGFDFRHYQKIHRELIYVARLAGSRSFGKSQLIYYLGGVDEWWKSDVFDESTPIDQSTNYGFQAQAANMRGFLQNIRNGNSFMLLNQELRFPVFSYFINRPIQSDFIRDFQIIGFGDIGTAWTGGSPYDDDNPLNNETLVNGSITVTYENINDPLVGGFGFGFRSTLLGYFVRMDWAWGVENGEVSKESTFIFSLGLDI